METLRIGLPLRSPASLLVVSIMMSVTSVSLEGESDVAPVRSSSCPVPTAVTHLLLEGQAVDRNERAASMRRQYPIQYLHVLRSSLQFLYYPALVVRYTVQYMYSVHAKIIPYRFIDTVDKKLYRHLHINIQPKGVDKRGCRYIWVSI